MSDKTPPALSTAPQFTPEHWARVPRQTTKAHIQRVTNLDEGWVEIVLKEGMAFRRRREEIAQLLTANLEVHLETVNQEIVTGLFVPGIGWAFRMSNDDLAAYTREIALAVHDRERRLREAMERFVAEEVGEYLAKKGVDVEVINRIDVLEMARHLLARMEEGPQR